MTKIDLKNTTTKQWNTNIDSIILGIDGARSSAASSCMKTMLPVYWAMQMLKSILINKIVYLDLYIVSYMGPLPCHIHIIGLCTIWIVLKYLNSFYAGDRIFWLSGSIPCLLMHWLLKVPMHQQAWYWLCRTDNMSCCSRLNFIFLGQAKSKTRFKMWIYILQTLTIQQMASRSYTSHTHTNIQRTIQACSSKFLLCQWFYVQMYIIFYTQWHCHKNGTMSVNTTVHF